MSPGFTLGGLFPESARYASPEQLYLLNKTLFKNLLQSVDVSSQQRGSIPPALFSGPSLGIGKSQEEVEGQSVLGNRIWERRGRGRGCCMRMQFELKRPGDAAGRSDTYLPIFVPYLPATLFVPWLWSGLPSSSSHDQLPYQP
ncbi:uncharacterized protein PGTG_19771 [Puccinia graminis f. sp. tritici CRL 75-36-700-3]|uniref:Uncharacterized protein n=1 Tax=Puccinia graminis f. sp. tritici (strain CRL 75-36-700-3 / race SCCL) TaxID=418459 RepID=E3LBU9_PUCGT|nr:uncharacterized protein PGTG_19771 [Puccinia graminis f. sp. tritici CRL 75-36-700-3]EFP94024.1 hypothetical protein PGTG_19771 [Puccinia graminis f. sp. tritici CRL 75-36-700-3]